MIMTREEERIEQIEKFASQCYEDGERYSAFISGAIWADDNPAQDVVNLNDVWHDASEEPQDNYIVLCDGLDNLQWVENCQHIDIYYANWQNYAEAFKVIRWAYVKDLLPKGGKK